MAVTWGRDGGLDKDDSSEGGEKLAGSRYTLKQSLTGFIDGLNVI